MRIVNELLVKLKVEHRGWNTENTESNSTQTPGKTSLPSQVDYEYWIYFRYSAGFKQTGQGQAKYLANFNLDIRLNYAEVLGEFSFEFLVNCHKYKECH